LKLIKPHFWLPLIFFLFAASCRERPGVLYINSYHPGYPSSDEITEGIKKVLKDEKVDLEIIYMDTKRNQEHEYILEKSKSIFRLIEKNPPEVMIVSDDNAVANLVVPHLIGSPVPIVFCGVNWTADSYHLPPGQITGMLEVLPVKEGIQTLMDHGYAIKKVTILSENSASEQKNIGFISGLLENTGIAVEYRLAGDFDQWKEYFIEAGRLSDAVYMPTNGAIRGWDHEEAVRFIHDAIKVPLVTCDEFMMPYAVVGVTKIQEEQGEWAGKTALRILDGAEVRSIPVTSNSRIRIWWNPSLAEKIGFEPGEPFLNQAMRFEY
jgi:ABC-type uncharacterized transport system substrate-binding protein